MCARSLAKQECLKRKIERKQKLEKSVKIKEKKKRTKKLGTIGLEKKERQRKRESRN